MSKEKPPDPKADALGRQLKDSLAERRPRPWKLVLASIVIATSLLGLLAWWMYPRPRPALLQVMALDIICTPDEKPQVRAQLIGSADDKEPQVRKLADEGISDPGFDYITVKQLVRDTD